MRLTIFAVVFSLLLSVPVFADEDTDKKRPGVLHKVITYIPNRVLDIIDIVRLRGRIGPGAAIGVRATEAADAFIGTYQSIYAGLPGPRGRRIPRLPVGLESRVGAEISVADISTGFGMGPDYSLTEFGFGFHALLAGLDLGVDPVELVDLLGGFFFLDIRDDDL